MVSKNCYMALTLIYLQESISRYDVFDTYKPPGNAIAKSKLQILKDSAILSLSEFNRIKKNSYFSPKSNSSNIYNSSDFNTQKTTLQNVQEKSSSLNQDNKALNHKNKILDYEKKRNGESTLAFEESRRKQDPYKVVGGRNNHIVKNFEQICRKAKIATIWDRQMEERKMMEGMYLNKEKRLDEMMELERLKEIKYIEDREKINKKIKIQSQKAIIEQIYDNDVERNKKREEIEREKILMLKQIEKMKEEEKKIFQMRKLEKKEKIKEFVHSLDIQALEKKKKKLQEKEEELKIEKFNIEKKAREEKLLEEKKLIAQKKERELQALREKQEKQKDKMDEINEIKARKAMIENEIKEKKKMEEETIKKEKRIKEMIECNDLMLKIKKDLGQKELEKDKEILDKMKQESLKEEEEEKIKKKIKIEKMLQNRIDLEKQIKGKEDKEKLEKVKVQEEGKKIRKEQDKYLNSLEEIRKQKIQELKDLNIKDAYIIPLEKYNYEYNQIYLWKKKKYNEFKNLILYFNL